MEEAIISKLRKLKALADRGEQGEAIQMKDNIPQYRKALK